jgi:hypothetical protein
VRERTQAFVCDLCGEALHGGRPWIMLNRYAVGSGSGGLFLETADDEGECVWDLHADNPDEAAMVTGDRLCVVPCLVMWIEGKLIETQADRDAVDTGDDGA